jgi:hypothetical protein
MVYLNMTVQCDGVYVGDRQGWQWAELSSRALQLMHCLAAVNF